ncbi:hypothetical protein [Ochrobactrum sp. BTU1]|uniref:hypothetical protein n=1 Tax=Ochrobactrum sp. BTU1 TaxID=2840456 RepID=UPI001C05B1BC|nr:hypothetical protein KMS41_26635 [Ochrobactrum sp. BTU1]
MPLFNEASRIYTPEEIEFLRECVTQASNKLSDNGYASPLLAQRVLKFYESGLRDAEQIVDLTVRMHDRVKQSLEQYAANFDPSADVDVHRRD